MAEARAHYDGTAKIDAYSTKDQIGVYMMVAPDGMVYGTTDDALLRTGHHHYIGPLLERHLATLVSELPLDAARHRSRYGWESEGLRGRPASSAPRAVTG